jgi:hypothetical protein
MNQRYPLIEGFGYFISIISVALLGMAACRGPADPAFRRRDRRNALRVGHDPALVCLVAPAWAQEASQMIGGLKGAGYMISTVSVALLGAVSWDATQGKPLLRWALIGGMAASVIGMAVRMISHIRDKKGEGS